MGDKQDLVDALSAEVHTVGSPAYQSRPAFEDDGFKVYNVTYYDDILTSPSGGVLQVRNADMIVDDDEGPAEEAWWLDGTPLITTAFVDSVRQSSHFTDKHGTILEEGSDWVIVEGYDKATDATKKQWLIEDDGAGGFDIYEVTNY